MGKLIFWVVVIAIGFAVYRLVQIMQRKSARARAELPDPDAAKEPIRQCDHCGVYFPASEAVRTGNRMFCSVEHRDAQREGS